MAKLAMEFLYHGAFLVREHKWEKGVNKQAATQTASRRVPTKQYRKCCG